MYGRQKSYGVLLEESGLKTLKSRREEQFVKFAKDTSQNPNYAHLFPRNNCPVNTRNSKTYKEFFARTDRLYNSPVCAICAGL